LQGGVRKGFPFCERIFLRATDALYGDTLFGYCSQATFSRPVTHCAAIYSLDIARERLLRIMGSMAEYFHAIFDEVQGAKCGEELPTLLLVDSSPSESSLEFFLNDERCIVLDGYKMHLDRNMKKRKLQLILKDARLILLDAMVHGKTVVFRLKDVCLDLLTCNDEHCKDLEPIEERFPPFGKMSYFPDGWFLLSGAAVRTESWYLGLIHRTDFGKHETRPPCHPAFSVIFTTTTPAGMLEGRLFRGGIGMPPIEHFRVSEIPAGLK